MFEDSDEQGSEEEEEDDEEAEWEDEENEIDEKLMKALAARMGVSMDSKGKIEELESSEGSENDEELDDEEDAEMMEESASEVEEKPAPKKQQPLPTPPAKDQKKKKAEQPKSNEPAKKAEKKVEKNVEKPKEQENKKPEPKAESKAEKPQQQAQAKKKTLPSGLVMEDVKVGNGPRAKNGKKVSVRYIGKLTNGKVFDSNTKGAPFSFRLGGGEVIKGWDLGVQGMNVGGTRKLTIPAALAYGSKGAPPDIPKNATLEFEVRLLEVKGN